MTRRKRRPKGNPEGGQFAPSGTPDDTSVIPLALQSSGQTLEAELSSGKIVRWGCTDGKWFPINEDMASSRIGILMSEDRIRDTETEAHRNRAIDALVLSSAVAKLLNQNFIAPAEAPDLMVRLYDHIYAGWPDLETTYSEPLKENLQDYVSFLTCYEFPQTDTEELYFSKAVYKILEDEGRFDYQVDGKWTKLSHRLALAARPDAPGFNSWGEPQETLAPEPAKLYQLLGIDTLDNPDHFIADLYERAIATGGIREAEHGDDGHAPPTRGVGVRPPGLRGSWAGLIMMSKASHLRNNWSDLQEWAKSRGPIKLAEADWLFLLHNAVGASIVNKQLQYRSKETQDQATISLAVVAYINRYDNTQMHRLERATTGWLQYPQKTYNKNRPIGDNPKGRRRRLLKALKPYPEAHQLFKTLPTNLLA